MSTFKHDGKFKCGLPEVAYDYEKQSGPAKEDHAGGEPGEKPEQHTLLKSPTDVPVK